MPGAPRDLATSFALLILRLGGGALLLYGHGRGKLGNFAERAAAFADPIGLGPVPSFWLVVFAEVLCAGLVVVGFLTRISTIPILIFLAVAAFVQHASDPWARKELPLLFAAPFLALLLMGPGRFSLDAALGLRWPWGGKRGGR
jgi:putative oxidoreductase